MKENVNKRVSFIYVIKENLWDSEKQEDDQVLKDQSDKDLKQFEAAYKSIEKIEKKYSIIPKMVKGEKLSVKPGKAKVKSAKFRVEEKDSKNIEEKEIVD